MSELLLKGFTAAAPVAKHRIVKFSANDRQVVQAAAASDASIGISAELNAATGETVDIARVGITLVEFGGTVARGAPITANADGKAVAAAPAAGTQARVIGYAEQSAVAGDIAYVLIAPGYITTPAA
jgi:hypothetical protein